MPRVDVVYHQFPHYRAPVLRELATSGRYAYRFWGSHAPFLGIEPFRGDDVVTVRPLRVTAKGVRWVLKDYAPLLLDRSSDAIIILGNPNMAASWMLALAGRLTGRKVLFWTHGWLRPEGWLKRRMRNIYYRLAHRVLVYGERAKTIGEAAGFRPDNIKVVYNSVDFDAAQAACRTFEAGICEDALRPQSAFAVPGRPLLICTARLTAACRFDLLFEAAGILARRQQPVNILLIGDGPERPLLEALARDLGIDVRFHGACHDEAMLATMIYHADVTVSPGKVGLTAIHSLGYGTPVITHGDLDAQMPEVEAIRPGVTGAFSERGNAGALATAITGWLSNGRPRAEIRVACRASIADSWTPRSQRKCIEDALDGLLAPGGELP
jgi:glycosyltransferase involved in cell wall biosynthesis